MLLSPSENWLCQGVPDQIVCQGIIGEMVRWWDKHTVLVCHWWSERHCVIIVTIVGIVAIDVVAIAILVLDVAIVFIMIGGNSGREQRGCHCAKPKDTLW